MKALLRWTREGGVIRKTVAFPDGTVLPALEVLKLIRIEDRMPLIVRGNTIDEALA